MLKRYKNEILKQSEKRGQNGTADSDTERQERMEAIIRTGLDKLEAKQLTIEFKDKTVYVRDGMRRVVQGILASKDLISAIVSTEPHATVVWAGVLLVLPVSGASYGICEGTDCCDLADAQPYRAERRCGRWIRVYLSSVGAV